MTGLHPELQASAYLLVATVLNEDSEGVGLLVNGMSVDELRVAVWFLTFMVADCLKAEVPDGAKPSAESVRKLIADLRGDTR
ncbi:hypothetical protein [Lentzea flava]|uniref:Uncharacterized protein n=1 Tax=Lentzea flava TaxID=103732 RepID=A0ABQ2V2I1_9PSEU|nr:hypothetical protein [Lentzea flava]MCP2202718.1 hypothetical protein [Lentzea flava]GGU61691.1 hypothetical protein GCM10010178_62330 [Lentzea flava]